MNIRPPSAHIGFNFNIVDDRRNRAHFTNSEKVLKLFMAIVTIASIGTTIYHGLTTAPSVQMWEHLG